VQRLAGLRLERVAAQMIVLFLHVAEALENPVHVVRARGIFHGPLQILQLVVQIAGPATACDGFIQHRPSLHFFHVLTEVADGQLLWNRDLAFVGRLLADHHAEQGRLAGAVGTDQTDLLAGV
jgi:hypothetical protein